MLKKLLEILSSNFPLILSTIVSLCALFVSLYQTNNQRRIKITELYFEAQLKAYTEFYNLIISLEYDLEQDEIRDIRPILKASKSAALISTHDIAMEISNFCSIYMDYIREMDCGKLTENTRWLFENSLNNISILFREEMFRHDTMKRNISKKYKKYFKKRWSLEYNNMQ